MEFVAFNPYLAGYRRWPFATFYTGIYLTLFKSGHPPNVEGGDSPPSVFAESVPSKTVKYRRWRIATFCVAKWQLNKKEVLLKKINPIEGGESPPSVAQNIRRWRFATLCKIRGNYSLLFVSVLKEA